MSLRLAATFVGFTFAVVALTVLATEVRADAVDPGLVLVGQSEVRLDAPDETAAPALAGGCVRAQEPRTRLGNDARSRAEAVVTFMNQGTDTLRVWLHAPRGISVSATCVTGLRTGWTIEVTLARTGPELGDAAVLIATASDGSLAELSLRPTQLGHQLQDWWDGPVVETLLLLAEMSALVLVVLLLSRIAADAAFGLWSSLPWASRMTAWTGWGLVALGATAVYLSRSDRPTSTDRVAERWSDLAVPSVVFAGALFVVAVVAVSVSVYRSMPKHDRRWNPALKRYWSTRSYVRSVLWVAAGILLLAGGLVLGTGSFDDGVPPDQEPWLPGATLIVAGGLLVSWRSAYRARVTLPVVGNLPDEARAIVERLPAAMRALGPDTPHRIATVEGTDLGDVFTDVVAVIPQAQPIKLIASILERFVPSVGYQLHVAAHSIGDGGHIAASAVLLRGSSEVSSYVADSQDLNRVAVEGVDRRDVVASALAAWLVVTLTATLKQPRAGLYGVTSADSLSNQTLAALYGNAGSNGLSAERIASAVDADPLNAAARFMRLVALLEQAVEPRTTQAEAEADVAVHGRYLDELDGLVGHLQEEYPDSPLLLRAAYQRLAHHTYATRRPCQPASATRVREHAAFLGTVLDALVPNRPAEYPLAVAVPVQRLRRLCRWGRPARWSNPGRTAVRYARELLPSAQILIDDATLDDVGSTTMLQIRLDAIAAAANVPLRAKYNAACLYCSMARRARQRGAAGDDEAHDALQKAALCLRDAAALPRLARWALRDPALAPLRAFGSGSETHPWSGIVYTVAAKAGVPRPAGHPDVVPDALALLLDHPQPLALDEDDATRTDAYVKLAGSRAREISECRAVAQVPEIGPTGAYWLHAIGLGSIAKVNAQQADEHPPVSATACSRADRVVARQITRRLGAYAATHDEVCRTVPTFDTVLEWVLACRRREPDAAGTQMVHVTAIALSASIGQST
jgi:hypothetical protein